MCCLILCLGRPSQAITYLNPGPTFTGLSLGTGDDLFPPPNPAYYDSYSLNWNGGDLTIAMGSDDFEEVLYVQLVIDEITVIDDVVSAPPDSPLVYFRPNAPAGIYYIIATSSVLAAGSYAIEVHAPHLPLGACASGLFDAHDEELDGERLERFSLPWPGGDLTVLMTSSEIPSFTLSVSGSPSDSVNMNASVTFEDAPPANYIVLCLAPVNSLGRYQVCVSSPPSTPTPTFTETETPTVTPTPTYSETPSSTPTDTATFTPTETATPSPTVTATPTATQSATPSPTPTASFTTIPVTFTATFTQTPTVLRSTTATPTTTSTPEISLDFDKDGDIDPTDLVLWLEERMRGMADASIFLRFASAWKT